MATGSPDYWPSIYGLYQLADKLDALDGTMDGKLDLAELNSSDVTAELVKVVGNLDGSLGTLKSSIDELIGVHEDTTSLVNYSEEDWTGTILTPWSLISGVNPKRNMLRINNTYNTDAIISRDGGTTTDGVIAAYSSAVFYDSPGVWLRVSAGYTAFAAHEEIAI